MRIDQLFPVVADLVIKFPDGSDSDITLKVVGQDSTNFHAVAKRHAQYLLDNGTKQNVDDLEKRNAELIAACVVGWSGLEDTDGTPLAYSPEKALELMSMPKLAFVREQVERYVAERQHFFRPHTAAA